MGVITHHVEVPRASEDGCMAFSARNLLDKNVEAASFRHLEALDILVSLFNLLMIEAQLTIRVVTPYKDLREIEKYRGCLGLALSLLTVDSRAWLHGLSPSLASIPCGLLAIVFDAQRRVRGYLI